MLEFLKNNIGFIKDLSTILFAGIVTIVAVLTYQRAKSTILQPIRTEAIKKQSELLTNFLAELKNNNNSIENWLNYVSLIELNVVHTLADFGFVFSRDENIKTKISEDTASWIPCGSSKQLMDVEIISTFADESKPKEPVDIGKQRYEGLKSGKVEIDKIYLTKEVQCVLKTLSNFCSDPFMPKSVSEDISTLLKDININLTDILKAELEDFILGFSESYFENNEAPKFNPVGVYNSFNHSRRHHRMLVDRIRNSIRKTLLIDEPW